MNPTGRRRGNEALIFFFALRKVRLMTSSPTRFMAGVDCRNDEQPLRFRPRIAHSQVCRSCVDQIVRAASKVYALYGKPANLMVEHPDCGHLFPPEMRIIAYRLLDQNLK